MKTLGKKALRSAIRLDDPEIAWEKACHDERANWLAARTGLPTIGSKLVNRYGIEWVVQNHATVPTADSLQRWRNGDVQPENDLYPVVAPQNFSPKLMEFFHAIDRCTTKTFAMLDTMPGRRKDGHVPGGNSIYTVSHSVTNLLFLDAARVHETVIAHEFGHAWVQYVDECEDLRTLEDASDPQRLRMVNFVQSFVLDLKVNDLIRPKGFEMELIEGDQAASLSQLAAALQEGYRPENPREQVFMSLLVADQMLQRDAGRQSELARFDSSLVSVCQFLAPVADLSQKMAAAVRKHGYNSHSSIIACVDECLTAAFEHCDDKLDLDGELVLVNPEEPDIDKFPNWIPILPPKLKCGVGRHMAKNDIPWEWAHSTGPTLTERTRVTFTSPEGTRSEVIVPHRIGPPTPYFGMDENMAEILELKRQNAARAARKPEVPLSRFTSVAQVNEFIAENLHPRPLPTSPPGPTWPKQPGRPYMAGLGRFLTAARLEEQMEGEHPYGYAFSNPVTYTDPSGLAPHGFIPPGSFPEGCRACSVAIQNNWFPLPQHHCNACYAHCTSCCVLAVLSGPSCASDMQNLQNTFNNPGGQYVNARNKYCGYGLSIAGSISNAVNAQQQCSSKCLAKCPYKKPNPRPSCNQLIHSAPVGPTFTNFPPTFPNLTQCDPVLWGQCRGR
jgi:hypothetical protein